MVGVFKYNRMILEATGGFEPPNRGFADLRLNHLATSPDWFYHQPLLVRVTGLVPRVGFEPTRAYAHGPLKTACLPVPPPRPSRARRYYITTSAWRHAYPKRNVKAPYSSEHLCFPASIINGCIPKRSANRPVLGFSTTSQQPGWRNNAYRKREYPV